MAWKVIVSYFHGSLNGISASKECVGDDASAASAVSDCSLSSSSVSVCNGGGDGIGGSKRRMQVIWRPRPSSAARRRGRQGQGAGGSLDSLDEEASLCSPATPSLSPSPSPPSGRAAATLSCRRSGSMMRVSASPLHRGSVYGSPAFRRKKMRAAKR